LKLFGLRVVAGEEDGREPPSFAAVAVPRGREGGREGEMARQID